MQQKRLVELALLGVLLALLGIITYQYMLAFVILAVTVAALFFREWVESLVEKIAAGNRPDLSETARMNETVASMRVDLVRINERLDALERRGRE